MLFLLLVFLFALIVTDALKNKKLYTPGMLFNGVLFCCLFLYSFRLSALQRPLSDHTVLLLLLAVIGFNLPVFASYFITEPLFRYAPQREYAVSSRRRGGFLVVMLALFLIQVAYSGGLPLIWKLTGDPRTYFDFGIPSLTGLFYGLVILLGAYTLFRKGIDKYFYLGVGVLIISRQMIIAIVLEGAIFKLVSYRKRVKHLLFYLCLCLVVGIVAFSLIGNFRTGENSFLEVAEFYPQYDGLPTAFKWIYSYLCISFSNFDHLVAMVPQGGVNGGTTIFNELLPTVLSERFGLEQAFSQSYLVSPNFTVSTFLPGLYLDFGAAGIFAFCLAIGWITQRVFARVKRFPNDLNCLVYAIIGHNLFMLFFTNMFFYLPVMGEFLFLPFLFYRSKASSRSLSLRAGRKPILAE